MGQNLNNPPQSAHDRHLRRIGLGWNLWLLCITLGHLASSPVLAGPRSLVRGLLSSEITPQQVDQFQALTYLHPPGSLRDGACLRSSLRNHVSLNQVLYPRFPGFLSLQAQRLLETDRTKYYEWLAEQAYPAIRALEGMRLTAYRRQWRVMLKQEKWNREWFASLSDETVLLKVKARLHARLRAEGQVVP